ncbi:MAG: ABC transporter substrate-binding protein/permease [Kiritimatiellae bacterium]|nr:ABC transporter substrate-binding protein/permease [Kiritimatiellia bacterium]
MKRLAFAVSLAAAAFAAAGGTLTMATEATFPPYEFLRGQEIAGIDVEICRAVAERLGRDFRAENMDFDSVIPAVISGKADLAAAGITVTEDRRKNVDFSVPYVTTGIVVIYRQDEPYADAGQLKGRKIGVQSGTTSENYVLENLQQEPERFKSTPEACAAMLAGRCAFVIADIDPAKNCVKGEGRLALSDFLSSESYAVAVAKGNAELLAAVNETIAAAKADGRLERWVADYTAEADRLKETSAAAPAAEPSWCAKAWQSLRDDFYLCFLKKASDGSSRAMYLVNGLAITLEVALFAILLGLLIGFLVAVVRSSHDKYGYFPLLNAVAKVYLTIIRGTPMVVQLLITYYIILRSVDSKVLIAILAFGINSGAYQAEILRAGIVSIDPGQMEAGRALGLGYWRTMMKVVLPQAIRNVLPALGNEFIVLMKDTSIVGYIALIDLAKGGDIIRSQTYSVYLPYLAVAAIYLVLVMTMTWLLGLLERHLRKTGANPVHNDS